MTFYDLIKSGMTADFDKIAETIEDKDIEAALSKDKLTEFDLAALLSPKALKYLEPMAQKAHKLTVFHFGKTIQLYSPLYISNYCENRCLYCGFNHDSQIARKALEIGQVISEAEKIAESGITQIVLLTGESRQKTPISYLCQCVIELKKIFHHISLEIFPLETDEYRMLVEAGMDTVTVYQETYSEKEYGYFHLSGKKREYKYRAETPERVLDAGARGVNIGALYGLAEPRKEAFMSITHAGYLMKKYIDAEIGISFPRIRIIGEEKGIYHDVGDKTFVQMILAARLYLETAGITISTRENSQMRENLIRLGVTKYSAGSVTKVGGYTESGTEEQFAISDESTVDEMYEKIKKAGYDPVMKDWEMTI